MKRKLLAAVAAGLMMVSVIGTASADPGGVPNANSCIGRELSRFAGTGGVGPQISAYAQNDAGPGAAAEIHAFREVACP